MKLEYQKNTLTVSRPSDAPRMGKESTFWHQLRVSMNAVPSLKVHIADSARAQGRTWFRMRPHKVALTSMPFGLRLGTPQRKNWYVLDDQYAMRAPHLAYNKGERVHLRVAELTAEGNGP